MGDVIQFPLNGKQKFVENEQERLANVKKYQAELCLNSSIELTYQLFEEIQARGIDLSKKEDLDRDMLMVCETLKSCLYKACGINHPLQSVTHSLINKDDSDNFHTTWSQTTNKPVDS